MNNNALFCVHIFSIYWYSFKSSLFRVNGAYIQLVKNRSLVNQCLFFRRFTLAAICHNAIGVSCYFCFESIQIQNLVIW